jgi:hypothetical protein
VGSDSPSSPLTGAFTSQGYTIFNIQGWVGAIIFAFKVMIFDSNHIENKLSYQPTVLKQLIWWVGLDHIKKLITYTHINIIKIQLVIMLTDKD